MRKLITFLSAVAMVVLTACGSSTLSDSFDAQQLEASAKTVIENVNEEKYEDLYNMFDATMQEAVPLETLKTQVGSIVQEKGSFVEYSKEQYTSKKDSKTGTEYAVCVLTCKYENGSLTYTISIDPNGKVCGLYLK